VLRLSGVDVEIVVVDVGVMVDRSVDGTCVSVRAVVIVWWVETLRSLRLTSLLYPRQTDRRPLAEREVWLKRKPAVRLGYTFV